MADFCPLETLITVGVVIALILIREARIKAFKCGRLHKKRD